MVANTAIISDIPGLSKRGWRRSFAPLDELWALGPPHTATRHPSFVDRIVYFTAPRDELWAKIVHRTPCDKKQSDEC